MKTEAIILAQGTQKRLGMKFGYKQLLRLPERANMPIMLRTALQCRYADVAVHGNRGEMDITVVCASPLALEFHNAWREATTNKMFWHTHELAYPGNSSLKGIARYLETTRAGVAYSDIPDRTIVLFGDVVYSWACLSAIWGRAETCGWVGTSNLSAGGGELWGVAWSRPFEDEMMRMLRDALLRHPPFAEEYQPGQMRRWISGGRSGDIAAHVAQFVATGHYVANDDYTHDIDLPHDFALLPELSVAAAADDKANWP